MVTAKSDELTTKLSRRQKWEIAALLCLQVPAAMIFYPVAAVLVLTGILAPLSIVLCRIGTMPLSLAMKLRDARQSG